MLLHPDRYSTSGVTLRKLGVVIHTNEGPDGSGASLLRYLQSPGDRPLSDGRKYGSGYHAIAEVDGWKEIADETAGPFHAPPLNKTWWSICLPGYARQSLGEWLDPMSRGFIRGAAAFIVNRQARDGFPFVRPTVAELRNGAGGICAHWDVSLAWKQTNHTDPGPNFPWEVLAADIAELTRPAPIIVPPTTRSVTMLLLDLFPREPARWCAFQTDGKTIWHAANGNTVTVLQRGSVPRVELTEPELIGMLTDVRAKGVCPVPSPSPSLLAAWNASALGQ